MAKIRTTQDVVEVIQGDTDYARVTQDVVEVIQAYTAASPTSPTGSFGVAVSQSVVEVMMTETDMGAHVSQVVVEVMIIENVETGGSGGGTVAYGFAV